MTGVKSHVRDKPTSTHETPEFSMEDSDDVQREPPPQPLVNFLAGVTCSQDSENSQAPTSGATATSPHQPSHEFLMALGIKVRDFAYENTLPAIVPVPRVPRQVQPTPRALKRPQRDWDNESPMNSSSPVRQPSGQRGIRKPSSLERKPTEPLEEPAVQHTRTFGRITMKRVCSILAPPSRSTLPTTPRARFSASPPTSPLTPPLSHFASQESELAQPSSAFPFVVHVDNPDMIPASQLDPESQPPPLHPVLYTRFTLESRSSPTASPPQNTPPAALISSFIELPPPTKELGAEPRFRRRRGRGTPPPSTRYQLRQRPVTSSHAPGCSRFSHQANGTSKSVPRRTRRVKS